MVLHPTKEAVKEANESGKWNNASYVLLITSYVQQVKQGRVVKEKEFKALIAGDIETSVWEELYEWSSTDETTKALVSNITVFRVSHHGRRSGYCGTDWLKLTKSKDIVISKGSVPEEESAYEDYRKYLGSADHLWLTSQGDVICTYDPNSGKHSTSISTTLPRVLSRFASYDFIPNLIGGFVLLWCMQEIGSLIGWTLPLDFAGGLTETSVLGALSYVTSLLLQGVSQGVVERYVLKPLWKGFPSERWLLPDDEHFSVDYKSRLFSLITKRFGVATEPELPSDCPSHCAYKLRLKKNRELFYLCYHEVSLTNRRPLVLNADYGLFRGLLTMFGLLAVFSFTGLIWTLLCGQSQAAAFGVWTAISVAVTLIAYISCKKLNEDFAQSVFDLFIVSMADKLPGEQVSKA
jgi:hypothetical protein